MCAVTLLRCFVHSSCEEGGDRIGLLCVKCEVSNGDTHALLDGGWEGGEGRGGEEKESVN